MIATILIYKETWKFVVGKQHIYLYINLLKIKHFRKIVNVNEHMNTINTTILIDDRLGRILKNRIRICRKYLIALVDTKLTVYTQ